MANIFSNIINGIMEFLRSNVLLVIGFLILCFVGYWLYKRGQKRELKPLSRSEVERKKFIERMKLNKSPYKFLFRGKECIGIIKYITYTKFKPRVKIKYKVKEGDKEVTKERWEETGEVKKIIEMVVSPTVNIVGNLRFKNPLGKEKCIQAGADTLTEMNKALGYIAIDEKVTFDYLFGIYYDRNYEHELINYIKDNSLFRTDWDAFASVYFAKAQEQSTFDPNFAHSILLKQEELEIEKQKRAKIVE